MAVFQLTSGENDLSEMHQHQMGRYVCSNKTVWRILSFPIHERHPTMIHLSVHFENGQSLLSRQKMLLNVLKHLRKQHSHLSSEFGPKLSLHAP
ncbi:hypothetical protein AVEN_19206-1 [Araneus ventricosus]|uniref:Uncharacterized protein n=1 Tax=Araneus ventricosus TaxID=182803 RepID=A0A4Y2TEQ5_ARAVE|nr:hypothetical protein AVEN_19206-1 [Araneus ventricosus]